MTRMSLVTSINIKGAKYRRNVELRLAKTRLVVGGGERD